MNVDKRAVTLIQKAKILISRIAIGSVLAIHFSPSGAQAPDRMLYSTPPDWTVTTYRDRETKAFLRCSAERHYENSLALTVAKNAAGAYVLGFTSSVWPYEDRSTHLVAIQVDSNEATSLPGRVRLLPSGPIVFLDLAADDAAIPAISTGNVLYVSSEATALEFDLTGSAAALQSLELCQRDASGAQ